MAKRNTDPGALSDPADAADPHPVRDWKVTDPMSIEDKKAKIAELQKEIDELSAPEPVEYPKWVHHTNGEGKIVKSREEEDALGDGWSDATQPVEESDEDKKLKHEAKIEAEAKVKAEAEAQSKLAQGKPL